MSIVPARKLVGFAIELGILLTLFLVVTPSFAEAATILEGRIIEDTTWTREGNPYIIRGDIYVPPEIHLTISEGVVLKFEDFSGLFVEGKLSVVGTAADRVTMTSAANDEIFGDTNEDGDETAASIYDIWSIYAPGGIVEIHYTDFIYGGGVAVSESDLVLKDVNFSNVVTMVEVENTDVHMENITSTRGVVHQIIANDSILDIHDLVFINPNTSTALMLIFDSSARFSEITAHNIIDESILEIFNSEVELSNIYFEDGLGTAIAIYSNKEKPPSDVMIRDSVIKGFEGDFLNAAINLFHNSKLSIENTILANNHVGVATYHTSSATIRNSSFYDNTNAIESYAGVGSVDAQNNWWGNASGPFHATSHPDGLGDEILDINNAVKFDPWLTEAPWIRRPSVAFIPGFQASRLFIDRTLWGHDRVWEPETFLDPTALYLDEEGISINNIMVGDAIDALKMSFLDLPFLPVYRDFFQFLDTLESNNTISAWKSLPYDWRFSQNEVASMDINLFGGTSYNMISAIEELADQSPNHKVTIIAHSNGGLVGKMLMSLLEDQGKADLIDQFIMIGTPQVGTPKAVAGILHGEDQGVLGGLIMREDIARSLAKNMPGAYGLLPSKEYFEHVADPVVVFENSTSTELYRDAYGTSIDTYEELTDFYLGVEGRSEAITTRDPLKLNPNLLKQSQELQQTLDTWEAPDHVEVSQIIGWGLPTIRGIEYYEREKLDCDAAFVWCKKIKYLDYKPLFTTEGDETVVYLSPENILIDRYFLELDSANEILEEKTIHRNLTESSLTQSIIRSALTGNLLNSPFISETKPITSSRVEYLQVAVYSPVEINLVDEKGNKTGTSEINEDHEIRKYFEEIPNSSYVEFGEGKYILVPSDRSYTLELEGYDSGTATLELSLIQDKEIVKSSKFENFPVLSGSRGTVQIDNHSLENLVLSYDVEGDGGIDDEYLPGTILDEPNTDESDDIDSPVFGTALSPYRAPRVEGEYINPVQHQLYLLLKEYLDILTYIQNNNEKQSIIGVSDQRRIQSRLQSLVDKLWLLTKRN